MHQLRRPKQALEIGAHRRESGFQLVEHREECLGVGHHPPESAALPLESRLIQKTRNSGAPTAVNRGDQPEGIRLEAACSMARICDVPMNWMMRSAIGRTVEQLFLTDQCCSMLAIPLWVSGITDSGGGVVQEAIHHRSHPRLLTLRRLASKNRSRAAGC